jgi:adenosylhomocysteine nucleosidase
VTAAVIVISADAEWRVARERFPAAAPLRSPYGEWFAADLPREGGAEAARQPVIFFQGGWGKISAAASAQWALDRWQPGLMVNLGTCGGLAGRVEHGEILLVERTLVYDVIEQMGDPQAAIDHYTVDLDLAWLREPYPQPVRRGLLVSADRDICLPDVPMLVERYGAIAADWESGAIAWVAGRNHTRCLILRGVSDLVGPESGEAYSALEVFHAGARSVMEGLLGALPVWLECAAG